METPIRESAGLEAGKYVAFGRQSLGMRCPGDMAPSELASVGMTGQEALGRIGQGVAATIDAPGIGRHPTLLTGDAGGHGNTRHAGSTSEAGRDQFAPGN